MSQKILIIEDDVTICDMVEDFLNKHDFEVMKATDGVEGLKLVKQYSPDLVILDIMIPYKSGDEVLKEIRLFTHIPVIIVSAKEMIQTKVDLFESGADDYMTKPFDLNELLARVKANLKRYNKTSEQVQQFVFNELTLDVNQKQVYLNQQLLSLTAKEFELLNILMKHPQTVYSKQYLYETVWNEPYAYDDHTINTHISNMRKKMKEHSSIDYIKTVWGMGYKLNTIS